MGKPREPDRAAAPVDERARLTARLMAIHRELHDYPRPVAGCDQQFNHLLEERDRIARELSRLNEGWASAP